MRDLNLFFFFPPTLPTQDVIMIIGVVILRLIVLIPLVFFYSPMFAILTYHILGLLLGSMTSSDNIDLCSTYICQSLYSALDPFRLAMNTVVSAKEPSFQTSCPMNENITLDDIIINYLWQIKVPGLTGARTRDLTATPPSTKYIVPTLQPAEPNRHS
jgi:hypothetical protein